MSFKLKHTISADVEKYEDNDEPLKFKIIRNLEYYFYEKVK